MAESKVSKHCGNCGAVVPKERGRSPFCSDTCKDAKSAAKG